MASVTQRISKIKQPYRGYLPIQLFTKEKFDDGIVLNENENIHPSLIGMSVDYLTRFMLGASADDAFHISCLGAHNAGMTDTAEVLKSYIKGLDDNSIIAACKLAGFDVYYRSPNSAHKSVDTILPDTPTIENIRIMVNRSISFFDKFGPVICSEPTFEGGYTDTVNTGDCDFLTNDTLWDFKVSKSSPTSKHTLQILMYYIMGLHSIHDHFKQITKLGFFNPRLNTVYLCAISSISHEIITEIENDVICYGSSKPSMDHNHNTSFENYSVADVCNITGLNKNEVYKDIRNGYLIAYRKANKYYITEEDLLIYIDQLKRQQKLQIIITAIIASVFIAFAIFMIISF